MEETKKGRPAKDKVTLDFLKYPELLKSISEKALAEFRTPEQQILFMLNGIVKQ